MNMFIKSEEETKLIKNLETEIAQSIKISKQPNLIEILCLATYRPFLHYDWLSRFNLSDQIKEFVPKFIDEPLTERALKNTIPLLNQFLTIFKKC